MKILLTGATGFLGSALLRRFKELGIDVVVVGRKANDICLSDELSPEKPIDGCVHLATCYLPSHTEEQIPNLIESNLLFGTRIAEAAVKLGCRWFVNAATFWQHASDGVPVNLYAATKEAFLDVLAYYSTAHGLKTANLELTDTYGENDPRKKLVNLWCNALYTQTPLPMSLGRQEVELVHKDDVVEAFVGLSQMLDSGDVRVAGCGETYYLPLAEKLTLRQVAAIFERATGGVLSIEWGARPERAREIMRIEHRGSPLPGWQQHITLEDGFRRVYAEFKNHIVVS